MQVSEVVGNSKASVDTLADKTATNLQLQEELTKDMKDVPSQVSYIRQHLK